MNRLGVEGDKYMLICLLENLDLKEYINSSSKDKNPISKQKNDFFVQRLNQSINQYGFLDYFASVLEQIATLWHMNVFDLVNDMSKLLKLSNLQLIAMSLSCFISPNKKTVEDGTKLLKKSLQEYHSVGKVQIFPDHIQHMLLYVLKSNTEFKVFFFNFHFFFI